MAFSLARLYQAVAVHLQKIIKEENSLWTN